jgi:hypothetical protein
MAVELGQAAAGMAVELAQAGGGNCCRLQIVSMRNCRTVTRHMCAKVRPQAMSFTILQIDNSFADHVDAHESSDHPTGLLANLMCIGPSLAMTTDGEDMMAHVGKSDNVHVTVTGQFQYWLSVSPLFINVIYMLTWSSAQYRCYHACMCGIVQA